MGGAEEWLAALVSRARRESVILTDLVLGKNFHVSDRKGIIIDCGLHEAWVRQYFSVFARAMRFHMLQHRLHPYENLYGDRRAAALIRRIIGNQS